MAVLDISLPPLWHCCMVPLSFVQRISWTKLYRPYNHRSQCTVSMLPRWLARGVLKAGILLLFAKASMSVLGLPPALQQLILVPHVLLLWGLTECQKKEIGPCFPGHSYSSSHWNTLYSCVRGFRGQWTALCLDALERCGPTLVSPSWDCWQMWSFFLN